MEVKTKRYATIEQIEDAVRELLKERWGLEEVGDAAVNGYMKQLAFNFIHSPEGEGYREKLGIQH